MEEAIVTASGGGRPLVSVVTPVLNGAATLARAIESVLAQSYRPIEHVVIDGGSSDGTLDVLRGYADRLAHWQSEPDDGISDGFNKGLARAKGALVAMLNADDWLAPDQIEQAALALERSGAGFVFGDLVYHRPDGEALFTIRGDADYAQRIDHGMPDLNHPTVLARRTLFAAVGGFDPAYRYAMDYDWLLRVHLAGFQGVYAPQVQGHMTLDGAADRHWYRALAEVRRIAVGQGEPALAAWARYGLGIGKGATRRALERVVPTGLHAAARRLANPSYGAPSP
jgi:glycosyltransferase involved in cell wall biosynthesis